jgi:hypothetical protein
MRKNKFHPDLYAGEYTFDPDARPEPCKDNHCTPEKLEALIRTTWAARRRMPTLEEIKHEFGGILGAMVDYWKLEDAGIIKDGVPQ